MKKLSETIQDLILFTMENYAAGIEEAKKEIDDYQTDVARAIKEASQKADDSWDKAMEIERDY